MPANPQTTSPRSFAARWKSAYVDAERPSPLPAAYLFAGPAGSGKKANAEEIIKSLLGRFEDHPDFLKIQPEKNAIKIEAIRTLIQRLSLKPFEKNRIVVWIEDADALTEGAANALLKTLEEPPGYVTFFLITAKPDRVLPTIRSRCQRVNFQLAGETLKGRLEEIFDGWREELGPLLRTGTASFAAASKLAESVSAQADRLPSLFDLLRTYWRDLTVWKTTADSAALLLPNAREFISAKAQKRDLDALFADADLILETERAVEGNVNKMLALERLFFKLL